MKNLMVLGMILVVLLVCIAIANAVHKPDDTTLADWYIRSQYGPNNHAIVMESKNDDYIEFNAVDDNGRLVSIGTILRSYCLQEYERNN